MGQAFAEIKESRLTLLHRIYDHTLPLSQPPRRLSRMDRLAAVREWLGKSSSILDKSRPSWEYLRDAGGQD